MRRCCPEDQPCDSAVSATNDFDDTSLRASRHTQPILESIVFFLSSIFNGFLVYASPRSYCNHERKSEQHGAPTFQLYGHAVLLIHISTNVCYLQSINTGYVTFRHG